ncbi:hypothetical protein G7Y79_00040g076670 [Physcia stellaris]|nr:hypothetical protein G7Y79_00040g076670 [Physcia stellaris]
MVMATRPPENASKTSEYSSATPVQRPNRHRAPPPLSLASFDQLNPYKTASARSSSPNYLTPPVTSVPLSSPPPLLIANDYLNAHANNKKRRLASDKKLRSSPLEDGQSPNTLRVGVFGSPANISESGDINDVDPLENNRVVLDSDTGINRQTTLTFGTPTISGPTVHGEVALHSPTSLDRKDDSAATSLRKINPTTKEPSLFGSRRLSRISQALVGSIYQPRTNSWSREDSTDRTSKQVHHAPADEDDNFPSTHGLPRPRSHLFRGTHLGSDTPATITLRKASDAYFVVIGQGAANGDISTSGGLSLPKPPPADRKPSVALMDFRSKRMMEHRKSLWYSLPLLSDQNVENDSPSEEKAEEKPVRQENDHEPLSIFSNLQGSGTLAEPAITFTDVHPAPQSFASVPYSCGRPSSMLGKPRRTSSVHIKTRSSVHEIIWREDETSSGSSSQESINPVQTNKADQAPDTMTPRVTRTTSISKSAPTTPILHLENSKLHTPREEKLFEWSWNAQQAGESMPTISAADPPASAPVLQQASSSRPHRRSVSKESSQSSVESFPPLMDRQNTTEWRRAPLVDLNDPMSGRVTRMWLPQITAEGVEGLMSLSEEPADLGSGGKRFSMDGEDGKEGVGERRRRSSAHPHAPARLGLKGRVGSSIGSSSHKKMICFV